MEKYKVLASFIFRGVKRKAGDIIELTESKLQKLTAEGFGDKVEKVGSEQSAPANTQPEKQLPQKTMAEYKVVEAFETPAVEAVAAVEASEGVEAVAAVEAKEAVQHNVGDVLELTEEAAAELGSKVEKTEAAA